MSPWQSFYTRYYNASLCHSGTTWHVSSGTTTKSGFEFVPQDTEEFKLNQNRAVSQVFEIHLLKIFILIALFK